MARYQRGVSQRTKNPKSGRKKGTPNKATAELKGWCQRLVKDPVYRKNFVVRWQSPHGPDEQIEKLVWYYAAGKPREEQHITGSLGPLVQVITRGMPTVKP